MGIAPNEGGGDYLANWAVVGDTLYRVEGLQPTYSAFYLLSKRDFEKCPETKKKCGHFYRNVNSQNLSNIAWAYR